ncbi:MAG TPA: D-2-hydroxyacid dehydrogenase [Gaiellaceae bacterium]
MTRLVFTSPLQPELVERVRAFDDRVEVVYPDDLIAPARYPSDHVLPSLDGPGSRERWEELLDEAEILWDFGPLELAPTLASRPRLRWIQGTSAGIGRLAERVGLTGSDVIVTTASGVHARPLAEFVLLAMLMFSKHTLHLMREQQAHRYERHAGHEVRGKVVCVVGLGKIGREVARVARGLDARVIGTVRDPRGRTAADLGVDELGELDSLLPQADVVVLATPHTPETHRLLDERRLGLLKPGALLVNIARGDVVDEAALVEALREGRLGGAALDVYEREPLPPDSPLWDLPNVYVSPHSASTVAEENERIVDLFCENLRRYLGGEPLLNELDKELLY